MAVQKSRKTPRLQVKHTYVIT